MRIDSGTIGMESARRYTSSTVQYTRFALKDYSEGKTQSNPSLAGEEDAGETREEKQSLNNSVISLQERIDSMRNANVSLRSSADNTAMRFRYYTTRFIFHLLFGEEKTGKFLKEDMFLKDLQASPGTATATMEVSAMTLVSYTRESYFAETESVSFCANGKVTCADGRSISFNVEVGMSRSFYEYYKEEYSITQFKQVCDPLVINLDGDVAQLSDQKFFFDLDADGEKEEISTLGSGSGYLALDKNGDGVINDGSELFGPQSGDGFAELAEYDTDGDGWIDEDDEIWSKLKIWCRDENGEDILYTLREVGVGAICLQNVSTDFSLNNAENISQGYLRSTGIFLYENGEVGTVQHLDLVQ